MPQRFRVPVFGLSALILGIIAIAAVGRLESRRAQSAAVDAVGRQIGDQIGGRLSRASGHAQILAGSTEVREGVSQRNRVILRRALRRALAQMDVNFAGIVLSDGTRYYALPSEETTLPLLARRAPIEHELRTIAHLEYGVLFDEEFLQRLASALGTGVRAFDAHGIPVAGAASIPATPVDGGGRGRRIQGDVAYVPLNVPGGVVAILGFRIPANASAARRIRRERNIAWAAVALAAVGLFVADVRRSRRVRPAGRPFSPITNPYIVGNPIRTGDMFFGRDDDFQFARQKLTSERAGVVLVFCGERRSGKTSILFQILGGRLGGRFLPVLIDMQYFAATSGDADLYRSIYREVAKAVHPETEPQERLARFDERAAVNAAAAFEAAMDDAIAAHPGETLLLLFDEYEILESKIERGELSRNVIPFLAGLLERKRDIAYVFTGSKNLEERATQHWRVMLGKSLYRKISYLTPQDTERLIREPVRAVVDYDPAAVARIARLTSGQPFYTQVICQNLVDHLNEHRKMRVEPGDVAAIVDAIVDNPLPQMIYFWDSLPADQKLTLSLLAETLDDETAWATPKAAIARATASGVPLTVQEAQLQTTCDRLFEMELLEKSPRREFRYRIDLLRHWVRRTHSIWQVVKEAGHVFNATA